MNARVVTPIEIFSRLRSHYLRDRALYIIYLSEAIKTSGISMISVFETIYLYLYFQERGFSSPVSMLFLFFAVFFLFFALLSPLGAYLSARFGFHKIALVSSFFLFFYFIFLFLLPKHPWLLIPALASIILRSALFWPGFHLLFATSSTKEKRGNAFGNLTITTAIASVGGPILGGFIVTHFGYQALFMFSLPLIIISATPLFLVKNAKEFVHEEMSKTFKRLKSKSELQAGIAFATSGAEDEANLRLWPLFLFFIAISYSAMGIIVSLAIAFSLLATWYLGKLTDTKDRLKLLSFGSILTSGSWILRAGVVSPFFAGLTNIFYGVARTGYSLPLMTIFYNRSVIAHYPFGAIVFREVTINLGKVVFLLFLALAALWIKDFRILILLTAILPLFSVFIRHWKP